MLSYNLSLKFFFMLTTVTDWPASLNGTFLFIKNDLDGKISALVSKAKNGMFDKILIFSCH